jgi:hypothetical protein
MAANTVPIPPAAPATQNILFVVLHGLISLVDIGKGFIAYALEIGNDHRYLYGNWLTEEQIPPRPQGGQPLIAELVGVDPGEAGLDQALNVVVEIDQAPDVDDEAVRAVFKLPKPSKIHHFIAGTVSGLKPATEAPETMPPDKPVLGKPVALSGIRVFEYTFTDSDNVHLTQAVGTDPLWLCPGPVRAKGSTANVAVLHIYDQPGEAMKNEEQHTLDEFRKSAAFLGANIVLADPVSAGPVTMLLPGLQPGEVSCLSRRNEEVLTLVDNLRAGKTLNPGTGGCPGSGGVCAGCSAQLKTS